MTLFIFTPISSIMVFIFILVLVLIIFYPRYGILSRYKKIKVSDQRIQLEDALKHIFDYEYRKLKPTLGSIAGILEISVDNASKIVAKLKKFNLVVIVDNGISLTNSGKNYALRVIRVHRLWESYLADEIGTNEEDWHDEAELIEHLMSPEEADVLSAKIGNPKFDPHGDPIPTNEGILPEKIGVSLNEAEENSVVKILHIEDEPKSIYIDLVKEKLFPGKVIKVVNKSTKKLDIISDGKSKSLSPLLAENVQVEVVEQGEFIDHVHKNILNLRYGEVGEILQILPECRGQQRRRLLDFGIVPGAKITLLMKSPLNDPVAFVVKDTIVALRRDQAKQVILRKVG
ncbi:MAG: metal-dependent transcriptional regulator [Ignavibacteriales bacterium]|nr:metal-dependent transcriptional regulator [Ignavibacteriales bacterium]